MMVQFGLQERPLDLAQRLRTAALRSSEPRRSRLTWLRTNASASCSTSWKLPGPQAAPATTVEEALAVGAPIGYPVLVRPSYVLGGRAMVIAYDADAVAQYMKQAVEVLLGAAGACVDHFLEEAPSKWMWMRSATPKTAIIAGVVRRVEEARHPLRRTPPACCLPWAFVRRRLMCCAGIPASSPWCSTLLGWSTCNSLFRKMLQARTTV